eukprot:scaffold4649_cov55-Phaeocystis_antarctica.AAC.6
MQGVRCRSYGGLGAGSRGFWRACRATSRTASSGSVMSRAQICIHRSGSSSLAGWASATRDDVRKCRREIKLRSFRRKKLAGMEEGVASSSRRRTERSAVCCTELRRRALGEEGANPSCASPEKCDMASVSAGGSSSGLSFST